MTNPRSKTQTLSKTASSYCQQWLKEQIYGRKKEFGSKYTNKGNIVELESLNYIAKELDYDSIVKNEESFENEFLTGTPDAILDDHIIDVKNSWDCFTFPLFYSNVPSKDYYWQAQGYMALVGCDSYRLIYTLMDTPEELIEKEYFGSNLDYEAFSSHYKYKGIESKYRIKVFDIYKNFEDIERIYTRVKECREYINNINP